MYCIPCQLLCSCTRDERRERIVAECNSVRQALQDLLTEYMSNAGNLPTDQLDNAIETMCRKTRDLRRQLRKAVVDHVSDSFLEPDAPLHLLIAAAKEGNEKEVEAQSALFQVYYPKDLTTLPQSHPIPMPKQHKAAL